MNLKKLHEKEALRKREAYIKNKNSDSSKIVEKKLKRKMQKLEKTRKMNCDELKKERETEAIRKREAYINKKSDDSKIVEKKLKRKM